MIATSSTMAAAPTHTEAPRQRQCKFHHIPGGCRKGGRCEFAHDGPHEAGAGNAAPDADAGAFELKAKDDGHIRFVVVSDTHNQHARLVVPDGDVVVHLGDAADRGNAVHTRRFAAWFDSLPHAHKLIIYGNHDPVKNGVAKEIYARIRRCQLLVDETVEVCGVTVHGTAWLTPCSGDFSAWPDPGGIDILLSHTPPGPVRGGGAPGLLRQVMAHRIPVHLFGHCHWARGHEAHRGTTFVNCATVGNTSNSFERIPVAPPVVVDFDPRTARAARVVCAGPPSDPFSYYGNDTGKPRPPLTDEEFERAVSE